MKNTETETQNCDMYPYSFTAVSLCVEKAEKFCTTHMKSEKWNEIPVVDAMVITFGALTKH